MAQTENVSNVLYCGIHNMTHINTICQEYGQCEEIHIDITYENNKSIIQLLMRNICGYSICFFAVICNFSQRINLFLLL